VITVAARPIGAFNEVNRSAGTQLAYADAVQKQTQVRAIGGQRGLSSATDLRRYSDCRSYADRFMAKAHHDVLYDVFTSLRRAPVDEWLDRADQILKSRPIPVGGESELELAEMRDRWRTLSDQALACQRHAWLIEQRNIEEFENDYRAVMAEQAGIDPLDVPVIGLDVSISEVLA
jgi:hypothetical protein